MPYIYLRVPHYVASYLRNKDRNNVLEVGTPIQINKRERIWIEFCEGLYPNFNNSVNRSYCFCQRQWAQMMEGFALTDGCWTKGEKALFEHLDQLTLNDQEIKILAGLDIPRGDDKGEYICLAVPKTSMRHGKVMPTNTYWQLNSTAANSVRSYLVDEFWRTLFAYIDRAMDYCSANGKRFVFMEVLGSFMNRYDIRDSKKRTEIFTLKRNYYRKRKSYRFDEDDYVEYG